MKILMVNKFLYPNGGSETYIFKLGEYMNSHGHEVQYFGMEHEGRIVGNHVNAYTSGMDFHGGSKLSQIMYPIRTIYSTEARRQIRKVLEDFRPDVVHLNNFNYQLTPSIILEIVKWRKASRTNCKLVYTAHDYQLICPNHMLRNPNTHKNCEKCIGGHFINCAKGKCIHGSTVKSAVGTMEAVFWKLRGAYKYIDTIICPSNFVKSKLDTNPLFKSKTITIHNFIDIPEYEKKSGDKQYVLYFGRLSEEKGVSTLLDVCKSLPDVKFIFVGTGPLSDDVKGISNIEYKGFQQGDDLWDLIANAKFCVCPSEWNEVFGLTIGEAIALGTPVVASNIGGIPEGLGTGEELVIPGNVQELTDVIKDLWNNPDKIEELNRKAECSECMLVGRYYAKLTKVGEVLLLTHDKARYVFYFGRLSEEKGVHMLVKVAQMLPKIKFVLAGNGPLDDNIDGDNIQKVGFVGGRLLQTLIKNAEFVVSPSVCTETFGLSNGEAIKLGTPVIATNLGAFPETVNDKNGCLVEADNMDALKNAVYEFWNNETKKQICRNGCKSTVLLSSGTYGKQILDIYKSRVED